MMNQVLLSHSKQAARRGMLLRNNQSAMSLLRQHDKNNRRALVVSRRFFQSSSTPTRLVNNKSLTGIPKNTTPPACQKPFTTTIAKDSVEVSSRQLWTYFLTCAVPMLGFGFMDNTVMIQAGHYIDSTLGVWLGLSTMAAAACGQIVSAGVSVIFGDSLEKAARSVGILPSNASSGLQWHHKTLPRVQRIGLLGSFVGVVLGATIGLLNLYTIDTKQVALLKQDAWEEKQKLPFEIEVSNQGRQDATTISVIGPDIDGVLASMTASLNSHGYSVVELHAHANDTDSSSLSLDKSCSVPTWSTVKDVIVVRPMDGKKQVSDDELDHLAQVVLEACKDPHMAHSLKTQVKELESTNQKLLDRISQLQEQAPPNVTDTSAATAHTHPSL